MKHFPALALLTVLLSSGTVQAQVLKPGFDKKEYLELLKVTAQFGDSAYTASLPAPQLSKQLYRSPITGLDNCWDLWLRSDKVGIISLRGTTGNQVSWLENFYAAMVPASGNLVLGRNDTFRYTLSTDPKAAVHVGWLTGLGYMAPDILHHIDSLQQSGVKDFVIVGHSQGGALAYLLTAYLYNLQDKGRIPEGLRFKTYSSAGPKPGNLYFAYDYEARTRAGWAFNVVNAADWVPETPISIQTIGDYNATNPFTDAKQSIRKLKPVQRVVMMHAFNRLDRPARRLQRRYKKYLGKYVGSAAIKNMPGYLMPAFVSSSHYVRTGVTIVLQPEEAYYRRFPDNRKTVFVHHMFSPYFFLAEKLN